MTIPSYSQSIHISGEILRASGDPSEATEQVGLFDAPFLATKQPMEDGYELSLEPTGPNALADDRDVVRMLCAPMGMSSVSPAEINVQLERLVNSQTIPYKRLEASGTDAIRPSQVRENIHALLDILETGDALGWRSAQAVACLPEALAARCFTLIPETPHGDLRRILDSTPDVPQPNWNRLKRLSSEDEHASVRKWYDELPRPKQEQFYQAFVHAKFIEAPCEYQGGLIDLFIPKEDLPADVTEGQIHQVRLPNNVSLDDQGMLDSNIHYRIVERYHYGVPVLRWRKDTQGHREFIIESPQEQRDTAGNVIYHESLLGAVMLANLVSGAYSRTEIIPATDDQPEIEKDIHLSDEFKDAGTAAIAQRAALLPFTVMSRQAQVLDHPLVSKVETLLFTGA